MASNPSGVDFYLLELSGQGVRITVGVECSQCEQQFFDTRTGDRVLISWLEKAIQHGRSAHGARGMKFRPKPLAKAAFL
jgi:hypothetical protein